MFVRRIRVNANRDGLERAFGIGQKTAQQSAHRFDFVVLHFATNFAGTCFLTLMMQRDFHAIAQIREAVEESVRFIFPKVNGAALRLEQFGPRSWFKPKENLALDCERQFELPGRANSSMRPPKARVAAH